MKNILIRKFKNVNERLIGLKLYSSGCVKCKVIKNMLDDYKIPYDLITDEKIYLPIADKNNINFMPFAEINGVICDTNKLEQWIAKRKEN